MTNLNDNLIKSCTCNNSEGFVESVIHEIPVLTCNSCGVIHQYLPNWDAKKLEDWYRKYYHNDVQESIGHQVYHARYNHDKYVANLRLDVYEDFVKSGMSGLDIGSSNSAFVHACRDRNIDCWGVEPGENIGDDSVTIRSTIENCMIEEESQDFITMHDSLEHIVDVVSTLSKIYQFLKTKGFLIVDIPDYFVESGLHHWRIIQHLWFWNEDQMTRLFESHGFKVVNVTRPIPGKIVFYCEKL